jgi:ribosomal protein S27E
MQTDPAMEWRRLAEEYRARSDDELRELAADFADLTETAKQALRQEMRNRGLGEPEAANSAERHVDAGLHGSSAPAETGFRYPTLGAKTETRRGWGTRREAEASKPITSPSQPPGSIEVQPAGVLGEQAGEMLGFGAEMPRLVPDTPETEEEITGAPEYTWKTLLCECDLREEAMQLTEALRRAGIESWVSFNGYTTPFVPSTEHRLGIGGLKILVAADQLEQARAVAAQPMSQEIIDESKEEVSEFVEPKCPKCGSDDVVLEGVDPENRWRCEQCDAVWSDPAEVEGEKAANAGEGGV